MMKSGLGTVDLPIEALRSFLAVFEEGTIREAAVRLGVGQSEVKQHLEQLDKLLGRKLFVLTSSGLRPSEFGKQVSSYAGRMLSMYDTAFSNIGRTIGLQRIRVGLPRWVMRDKLVEIAKQCGSTIGKDAVSFQCDHLEHLIRDLSCGQLDVALLCNVFQSPGLMAREWWEDMYWVKSPDLSLRPGQAIPLVSWPGSMSDRLATKALGDAGIPFTIAFTASDLSSRLGAVAAGLGTMVVPDRTTGPDIHIAREDFLPPLPPTKKGIYLRNQMDARAADAVVRIIESAIRPFCASVVTAMAATSRVIPLHHPRPR